MDEATPAGAFPSGATDDVSLKDDMRLLVANARAVVEAEFAYQRARAAFAGSKAKSIAVLGIVAATFTFFAVMAAVVGAVIALGPLLTPWGAVAAVSGGLLLIVLICLMLVVFHVRQMKAVLSEKDDDGQAG
ncbi:MAG: phage holin family protein [Sphingomonadaceae bacterium]|nr:phage holin family protein [Sphingomonadaceae bacterium]